MNLKDGTFRSYHNPTTHIESNHPPNVIKHILTSIQSLLQSLFSNENFFQKSTKHYEDNLWLSGHIKKLTYKPTSTSHPKHSRHKKIIWFNLFFSKSFLTKLENFFSLIDLYFPRKHIYNIIFNRNKINLSYSCKQNKINYK